MTLIGCKYKHIVTQGIPTIIFPKPISIKYKYIRCNGTFYKVAIDRKPKGNVEYYKVSKSDDDYTIVEKITHDNNISIDHILVELGNYYEPLSGVNYEVTPRSYDPHYYVSSIHFFMLPSFRDLKIKKSHKYIFQDPKKRTSYNTATNYLLRFVNKKNCELYYYFFFLSKRDTNMININYNTPMIDYNDETSIEQMFIDIISKYTSPIIHIPKYHVIQVLKNNKSFVSKPDVSNILNINNVDYEVKIVSIYFMKTGNNNSKYECCYVWDVVSSKWYLCDEEKNTITVESPYVSLCEPVDYIKEVMVHINQK